MMTINDIISSLILIILYIVLIFILIEVKKRKNKKQLEKVFIIILGLIIFWMTISILQIFFANKIDIKYFFEDRKSVV